HAPTTALSPLSLHDALPLYPEISVEIAASLVLPADAKEPVPVLIMFGSGNLPGEDPSWPAWAGPEPKDPPSPNQLIAAGWGYVLDRKSTRLNSSHVSISYAV